MNMMNLKINILINLFCVLLSSSIFDSDDFIEQLTHPKILERTKE